MKWYLVLENNGLYNSICDCIGFFYFSQSFPMLYTFAGGRNGYGAKLCNIFSKEFTVETSSKEYGKAFKQVSSLLILTWYDLL